MAATERYIGLMSGTSMDAVDAVVVDFSAVQPACLGTYSLPMPADLRSNLQEYILKNNQTIKELSELDARVAELFTQAVHALLESANLKPEDITAIGSHGQTLYHAPNNPIPYTLQIGNPNIIAANTGITTIADFRRRDIALGGQGAPLVPTFHEYLFRHPTEDRVVVNIGGIANITLLPANPEIEPLGFDTGPGNTLIDAWIFKHLGHRYDADGGWARESDPHPVLLQSLLQDPYFYRIAPKSTGPEYFNLDWLQRYCNAIPKGVGLSPDVSPTFSPSQIQRTLTALTATTIAKAIRGYFKSAQVFVCGGGALNQTLMQDLTDQLSGFSVTTTDSLGYPGDMIEALAFAWLAKQTLSRKTGNLPSVTGASKAAVLGGIYYA